MNPPKVNEYDYINFLIATQKAYSGTEAERVQPESANPPAHDAITRLLHRMEPSAEALWLEAHKHVSLKTGILVVDDSTLDKFYAKKMELVTRHWSGKHGRVVQGINLITLLWTEGDRHIPLDYRFYEKSVDGATKNEHFRSMLKTARERSFTPAGVVFDSWYSSLENLKLIRSYSWIWLTRLKRNRHINPDNKGNRPVCDVDISAAGTVVHLKGYGFIKVFKIVTPNGDIDYWATNDLRLGELQRLQCAEFAWAIEEYHRGLKQCCGAERAQVRSSRAQRNHVGLAIRAFLRLELHWFSTGISWFDAKLSIVREAIRAYLTTPRYSLNPTA
ncbi:transposase IS4 family protein (plasmid) [Gloeocapsa sp. PCC 7428]|uniref:IS701 family transposase n=1 Tax=Gloeocapsa sp. PCC 7428 TaxID=1173026 RepID=UPI0002A5CB56|nr:transposase [Gloeocapsa sp. PCC 7428]AFZ33373.1 transposase IS4 family protein [Gloeocapsa sp. PCC 7428]